MTLSIASNRKFGVEIEFTGISIATAVQALVDAGISVNHRLSNNWNHVDSSTQWKVVTDSSVPTGGEVVSPILSGIDGLEQVRKAADAINTAGATANRSCGLHVHVDARDLNGRDVANVVFRYGKFESELDAVMPNSRRGSANTMCQPVARMQSTMRAHAGSASVAVRQVVRSFGPDRFKKVNLQAFNAHGSIEIRHHSGTVQSSKILPWIQFCVNFVEKSRIRTVEVARTAAASVNSRATGRARDSKTLIAMHKIVNALRDADWQGCDKQALADLCGIKQSSVVVYVSNLRKHYGFEIKSRRGMFVLRRNGDLPALANGAPAPVAQRPVAEAIVEVAGDSPFRGLPAGIASYFSERAVDLAA